MREPTLTEMLAVAKSVLTEKELEAWIGYHVLEWSYADIASSSGADRSTVQRRVKRGNVKVRNAYEEAA